LSELQLGYITVMSFVQLQRPKFSAIGMFFLGLLLISFGLLLLAGFFTNQAIVTFSQGKLKQAKFYVSLADPIVTSINFGSMQLSPDLKCWYHALVILKNVIQITNFSEQATAQISGLSPNHTKIDFLAFSTTLDDTHTHLSEFNQHYSHTWLVKRYLSPEAITSLQTAEQVMPALSAVALNFQTDPDQTWIILLQNSDEIRATGGFAGSYALLQIDDAQLIDLTIEDIYDADGQFNGYIDPPPGIKEYTSGNNGLRLPDANWWPDFPKSAQTMLQFFAFGNRQDISGVIAINLPLIAELLEITGPVWLPDNQVELTSNNIHQLLRSERDDFFPGSQQKKQLLSHAQSMLFHHINQLPAKKKMQVFSLLLKSVQQKHIQVYATDPSLESKFVSAQIGGTLSLQSLIPPAVIQDCHCQPRLIMQVESNVGINKVNAFVERTSKMEFSANRMQIDTTFYNSAPQIGLSSLGNLVTNDQITALTTKDNQNGYINYHRLYVDPTYQVEEISINGQQITKWDENLFISSDEMALREIGVLVATPAKQHTTLQITFSTPDGFTPPIIILPKQAGIPTYQYQIFTPNASYTRSHHQDVFLQLR